MKITFDLSDINNTKFTQKSPIQLSIPKVCSEAKNKYPKVREIKNITDLEGKQKVTRETELQELFIEDKRIKGVVIKDELYDLRDLIDFLIRTGMGKIVSRKEDGLGVQLASKTELDFCCVNEYIRNESRKESLKESLGGNEKYFCLRYHAGALALKEEKENNRIIVNGAIGGKPICRFTDYLLGYLINNNLVNNHKLGGNLKLAMFLEDLAELVDRGLLEAEDLQLNIEDDVLLSLTSISTKMSMIIGLSYSKLFLLSFQTKVSESKGTKIVTGRKDSTFSDEEVAKLVKIVYDEVPSTIQKGFDTREMAVKEYIKNITL